MKAPKSKALKIGFVLDDSLDTADGVQQYVMTLSTWMIQQGYDVHYLVGETKRRDIPQLYSLSRNVKVRFNKNRMSMPLPTSRKKLKALLEEHQFDILHVQLPYSPFLAGRVVLAAPPKTAVVGTFHVAPYSRLVTLANRGLHVLTKKSLARFDTILSVSSVAQAFAKKTYHITTDIVPNTVDTAPYHQAKPLPRYKDKLTVVFLGRLVERKGCQYLLEAVARLQQMGTVLHPYRVVVCSKGPLEASLKRYVAEQQLTDVVEFTGFVAEQDKPGYFASSDVAVFPSTGGESFGIVLIESMAASKGVVLAGNNPGYASVMKGHEQFLFDPRDIETFAQLLSKVLNDEALRKQARQWQQREVQQYDVATVGQRIIMRYREALHKRRA